MATPTKAPAPGANYVNFGDLSMYVAGGGIPPGSYALEFTIQMFQAQTGQGVQKGPPRLGVMITAHSLTDPSHRGDAAYNQFYSMGSQADKSFAPDAATGKRLVAIPGGPGNTLNSSTNWAIILKSLYDCGLPNGILSNDLSVLDGIHVQTTNVPEPEERKGFQSKTAEFTEERKAGTISIVTEIKDDGKPWENTGGIPGATGATTVNGAPAMAAPKLAPRVVAPKAVPKPAPAPVAVVTADAIDVSDAASSGATTVLEKNINGCTKLALRTGTFTAVKSTYGDDMAQAVQEAFFTSDGALNDLLGQLGYQISGALIKPL